MIVGGKCERANASAPSVVTGNAETKTVLPHRDDKYTYSQRLVQNAGATDVFFAIGIDASADVYHGVLGPKMQLAVPSIEKVSIYGAGAWTVSTLEITRA